MKVNSVFGIALMVAGVAMIFFAMGAHGATITVPGDYGSIQDAIDHAEDGDTIIVSGGPYYENITIDKEIALQGTGMPVIDGMGGTAIN
ncbi:MAG TPA: hypothetical protein ENG06_01560, partial [Thermoplasmatales archaeon]|nr:hypothetical protein [Thermoplasmatales archaeon]